ncbi:MULTISPECIES: ABC transporter permease [unclassified Methanoregula]|uniref:ABC transporter permease n=1 Tax=unclassified Methanoregula TaxID=2649730 RepID=UPI0009CBDEC5|nr:MULTISPECIES: ABC transporter permease [unclassified Methanoregula]OPX65142.1 MAG: ABC-2 type transporter [Methanoregula sp. PtaB.Bin085]OPY32054.1 MAG: ABC-2 type transporter [Methanoregula sp. PtaU1.Bin006]
MNYSLIIELTKRDFIERYSGSALGFAWSFIYPLINILIYMIIFGSLMGARLPGMSNVWGYGIYLIAGLIPWTAFANTVTRSSTVFLEKKHIISKIHVDLPTLPVFIVLSETITFCVTFAIFLLILFITGFSFTPLILFIPIIYIVQQVFGYALGFFLAMLVVFLRDLKEVVNICFQVWFWFTPIVYVFEILPSYAQQLLILNPMQAVVSGYHDIFVYERVPSFNFLALVLIGSLVLIALDYIVYKKLEKDIRDFI